MKGIPSDQLRLVFAGKRRRVKAVQMRCKGVVVVDGYSVYFGWTLYCGIVIGYNIERPEAFFVYVHLSRYMSGLGLTGTSTAVKFTLSPIE